MNAAFKFSFCYTWKGLYIDAFAQDERLLNIRSYASECLVLMQEKANSLSVYNKDFSFESKRLVHCVYSLNAIIHQCDSRLNSKENKDNVLYTGKLSQGKK